MSYATLTVPQIAAALLQQHPELPPEKAHEDAVEIRSQLNTLDINWCRNQARYHKVLHPGGPQCLSTLWRGQRRRGQLRF